MGGKITSRARGALGVREEGMEEEEEKEEEEEEDEEDEEEDEEEDDDDIVHVDTAVKIVAFIRRMTANVGCALTHRSLLSRIHMGVLGAYGHFLAGACASSLRAWLHYCTLRLNCRLFAGRRNLDAMVPKVW